MMNKNFDDIREFSKGLTFDIANKSERHDSYQEAMNLRLYSENGVLSLSSIKGTLKLYENPGVVKYLGGFAFKDQLVLAAKFNNDYAIGIENGNYNLYTVVNQSITYPFSQTGSPDVGLDLEAGLLHEVILASEVSEHIDFDVIDDSNESCQESSGEFDITDYYRLSNTSIHNFEVCLIEQEDVTPENNKSISDVFIVLTKEADNSITSAIVWNGYLNLDPNKELNMIGIDENSHYKRVYFTDSVNPWRTFNLKDPNLLFKRSASFNVVQDTSLLQPELDSIENDGLLKAMSVQYVYRLITKDGQLSKFSPLSKLFLVLKEDGKSDFKGGAVGEMTTKSINVRCPIPDYLKYDRIECFALEYETNSSPTGIKSLGQKDVSDIVTFKHKGTESDYSTVVTLAEILANAASWQYCNDLEINNNKLIAVGLRNQPYPLGIRYLEDQFLLRGWDENGLTHNCLINPEPQKFKYIDPADTDKYVSVIKRQFQKILVYGNFTIKFTNALTSDSIEKQFESNSNKYVDYIRDIYDWLESEDLSIFPNLNIDLIGHTILFKPENDAIITDLNDYRISINNDQSIVEFDDEHSINTSSINVNQLTPGAISQGFNVGNGIRLSWFIEEDLVLTRGEERYSSGPILPLEKPSLKKGFMKDEIYRLSVTFYKNGSPLFAIPTGDIQVPAMGDDYIYIDSQGIRQAVPLQKFQNQRTDGDKLYAQRVMLKAEVRVGCHLKQFVDSYQIQYVERTEYNRTIIAQGLSAPLQRVTKFKDINLSYESKNPEVFRKWTLPYRGGPLIDKFGLLAYDQYGESFDEEDHNTEDVMKRRILTHRQLMYFDSPDLIYGVVSADLINSAKAEVIGRLKTDHNRSLLSDLRLAEEGADPFSQNLDPAFSKKLWEGGRINVDELQDVFASSDKLHNPYHVDASVFSLFQPFRSSHEIEYSEEVNNGIILPPIALGTGHSISNNALTMGEPSWFYSSNWRKGKVAGGNLGDFWNIGTWFADLDDIMACEFGKTANRSTGYKTVFLRTKTDLFTNEMLGTESIMMPCNYNEGNDWGEKIATDSHALINLKLNNEATVYGGRNKQAFSKNLFIPLSKVIPIEKKTNQSQICPVEGDTYVTLFTRAKNTYHESKEIRKWKEIQNDSDRNNDSHDEKEYNRGAGWVYAVILETQIEERVTDDYRFYRENAPFNFNTEIKEEINPAYNVSNTIKYFSPRPYNFKDDPLQTNIIAASKVKLSGDFYDSFTVFLTNDFYPLKKKFGDITNVVVDLDKLYAIQETATTEVIMEPNDTLTTEEGREVQLAVGTGQVFHSDKIVSNFGTSIRGAVVKTEYGFSFYDERKNEFVRGGEALTLQHLYNLQLKSFYENDPVINTEGWYDDKYKETNIMLETLSGNRRVLSYNEVLKVFNGFYDYDALKYFTLNGRVFAPKFQTESELHELNKGDYLNLFGELKTVKVGVIVNGKGVGHLPGFRRFVEANIYKALSISVNVDYAVKEIQIYDNVNPNDIRVINGSHPLYKIKGGIHMVPLRNITDRAPKRGEWAFVTIEIESKNSNKIDIHAIVASLRKNMV